MPFSFFIFYAIKKTYLKFKANNNFLLFASIISIVFIVFFSISGTKLPNYTMPCYPFLAFVIAHTLNEIYKHKQKNIYITITLIIITLISLALPIAGYFALSIEEELAEVSHVAFWLLPTSIISTIGFVLHFKDLKKSFLVIACGWLILSPILFLKVYPELTKQSPVVKAKPYIEQAKNIVVYKRFDAAFPINYKRTYDIVNSKQELISFFDKHPDGYILTNDRDLEELKTIEQIEQIFECKALFESHTTRIFKKRTNP